MFENKEQLQNRLEKTGELMVVLESDREYELHIADTTIGDDGYVKTEGMQDGEYRKVYFPISAIEHYYTHLEN